jgi:hypothetical protein
MSRQELVDAFLDGQISRRTLIRRLIAGGVSAGAAISYAQLLAPERAAAVTRRGGLSDQYPLVDMGITSPSLASVRNNARITLKVFCTEELNDASFSVFQKTSSGGVRIGSKDFASVMSAAGSRNIAINVSTSLLAGKTSARFYIQMSGRDSEGFSVLASTAKTLS